MAKQGRRTTARTAPAQRKQARVHLAGPVFEVQRLALARSKGFPRAFYASSLSHGLARLDGDDEVGEMLGERGASLRARVVDMWQKMGNVVVVYEGVPRLAVLEE